MPSRSGGSNRQHARQQRTTTQRGYDGQHQTNRGRLIHRHPDGRRCWWCGLPMFKDPDKNWDKRPLNADHTKTLAKYGVGRTTADRLLHDTCNKQRGDGTRDNERPALLAMLGTPQPDDTDLGPLTMGWPSSWAS